MVHLVPLSFKGSNAAAVARLFVDNVWRLHDMPSSIVSDRDVRFTSAFWKELCTLTGTQTNMTTAYAPQGYGAAERTNGTMETILRA
jgi:transposase InsO family protein